MKIGTLLTAAIVSLSAVGGGLAAYVAVTKYQTMDKVSTAQSRLEIVRAVGDIPRYMNPERGYATNLLLGGATIDPKQIAELDRQRQLTDGALAKVNQVRATLPGSLDDGEAVAREIDALKVKFAGLRDAIAAAIAGPAEARRAAAGKIVADNSVFNAGVTTLLDEQVRRLAGLDGNAYRQASYANVAWMLRDTGGLNASLHKALVGAKRVATEPEKMELYRSTGRTEQILSTLQELRNNPATPANVMTALGKMQADYVERFGKALKFAKEGAVTGKYEQDLDTYYPESQIGLAAIITVRDAFYENAEQVLAAAYSSARFSFVIAMIGLLAVIAASAGLIVMVRRRILNPIAALTGRMSRLAAGEVAEAIPGAARNDEIGAMAAAVQVFKDNRIEADRLAT
ncbi:MAG: HAMP domain-containing protein, partial [Bradyrhizobium sp.]